MHTTGIVDGIGVDTTAVQRVLDAAQLGQPQVAALAHHLTTQVSTIDADGIIRPVAHLCRTFVVPFYVGADPPVPEQLHRCLEDGGDQLRRCQGALLNTQSVAGLLTEGDAFGTARPDPATVGNQRRIEILPGGTPRVE